MHFEQTQAATRADHWELRQTFQYLDLGSIILELSSSSSLHKTGTVLALWSISIVAFGVRTTDLGVGIAPA